MSQTRFPQTRREFIGKLTKAGAIGGTMLGAPIAGFKPAAAQNYESYRALVCIFLEGGCDNWSALPPFDESNYQRYAAARPQIAIGRGELAATQIRPINDLEGYQYAFHPQLRALLDVFQAGDLAVIQNIGTLAEPITAASVRSGSARVPFRLFSHSSQRELVLSGLPVGGNSGWGGRIIDVVGGANNQAEFGSINLSDETVFSYGQTTRAYTVASNGVKTLLDGSDSVFGISGAASLIQSVASTSNGGLFQEDYARLVRRAFASSDKMATAFSSVSDSQTNELSIANNELADQLRAVAKVIANASSLGVRRQVFHVKLRNWDSHNGVDGQNNFQKLGEAMRGFWQLLRRWGMNDNVATFTLSDFGRNLVSNGDGSDHGWGATYFVMGGAIKGGRIIGRPPVVGSNTTDTLHGGRLVPTTSIDQLSVTLASWMGVPSGNLSTVAPNIINFAPNTWLLDLFSAD